MIVYISIFVLGMVAGAFLIKFLRPLKDNQDIEAAIALLKSKGYKVRIYI